MSATFLRDFAEVEHTPNRPRELGPLLEADRALWVDNDTQAIGQFLLARFAGPTKLAPLRPHFPSHAQGQTTRRQLRAKTVLQVVAFAAVVRPLALRGEEEQARHPKANTEPTPGALAGRQRLSEKDLQGKRTGSYYTGLPLLNFDPNTGVGYGVRAYQFDNSERSDPLFAFTPYRHRTFVQLFASTEGQQVHRIDFDAPVLWSKYRLRAGVSYERNKSQNFFGVGSKTMNPRGLPGQPDRYTSFAEYTDALRLENAGVALARYDHYDLQRYQLAFSVEGQWFGGTTRPLAGLSISRNSLNDYTGQSVDAIGTNGADVAALQGPTRLREDCDAGELVGCEGGWDNALRLGIAFDTRDFEPDPNTGVFAELSLELASELLGSEFDYARFLAVVRGYYSPAPALTDLVLAARGTFLLQSPGTPFFAMNRLAYSDSVWAGLGGLRSLRGYRQDRFVGAVATFINAELRWTFADFAIGTQRFSPIVAPFLDLGRVFDATGDISLERWARGQGAALRIAWNQATVIAIDYAFSSEDTGLYINFGHQF